jgi:hypothetical protein
MKFGKRFRWTILLMILLVAVAIFLIQDVWVLRIGGRQFPKDFDYSGMVDQEYEYFQHLVDNIHLHTP